jgi:hypothetical protein
VNDNSKFYEDDNRSSTFHLLGGFNPENPHTAMALVRQWKGHASKINSAAQVLFRYRLLDVLATVARYPSYPDLSTSHPVPFPETPRRIQEVKFLYSDIFHLKRHIQIKNVLKNWTMPVTKLEKLFETNSTGKSPSSFILANTASQSVSAPGHSQRTLFIRSVESLLNAQHHISDVKLGKILTNVQALSFAMSWFIMVCISFTTNDIY